MCSCAHTQILYCLRSSNTKRVVLPALMCCCLMWNCAKLCLCATWLMCFRLFLLYKLSSTMYMLPNPIYIIMHSSNRTFRPPSHPSIFSSTSYNRNVAFQASCSQHCVHRKAIYRIHPVSSPLARWPLYTF